MHRLVYDDPKLVRILPLFCKSGEQANVCSVQTSHLAEAIRSLVRACDAGDMGLLTCARILPDALEQEFYAVSLRSRDAVGPRDCVTYRSYGWMRIFRS